MVNIEDSTLRLCPESELTIYQVEELSKQVSTSFDTIQTIIIDLSETDKIDTAGFQLLVSIQKSCVATKKGFEIIGTGQSVENFISLFGYEWDEENKDKQ